MEANLFLPYDIKNHKRNILSLGSTYTQQEGAIHGQGLLGVILFCLPQNIIESLALE